MKPTAFAYHAPATLPEALALLAAHGNDARPLAGGQSLVPLLNLRLLAPAVLVDINRLPGLAEIALEEDGLRVGAMARQRTLERSPLVARQLPALAEAMPHIGFPQTRSRGTLGGSLVFADPAAELPALAVALRARLRVFSQRGERTLAADALDLAADELLVEVTWPTPPPATGSAWAESARRQSHRALAGAIATVRMTGERVAEAWLTLFAVGPRPQRFEVTALRGQPVSATTLALAADEARAATSPPSDQHASSAFRRHLVGVLASRTLARAAARAAQEDA